jgi:hypothetical protein
LQNNKFKQNNEEANKKRGRKKGKGKELKDILE